MHIDYKPTPEEINEITNSIFKEIKNPNPANGNQSYLEYVKPRINEDWSLDIARFAKYKEDDSSIVVMCNVNDCITWNDNYNIIFYYDVNDKTINIRVWPKTSIILTIDSYEIESSAEMMSYIKLPVDLCWAVHRSKWDKRKNWTSHETSHIYIDYDMAKLPWPLDDNLIRILDYMDSDKEWLLSLIQKSEINMYIKTEQHWLFNRQPFFDKDIIKRLAEYSCSLECNYYVRWLPDNLFHK